jgi:predicted RNA-binding Zn ribbon-like protein
MLQRPLVGEPLALDLVNTQWLDRGELVDFFDTPDGLPTWLAEHQFPDDPAAAQAPLREARAALRRILQQSDENGINRVLSHGAVRFALHGADVQEHPDVDAGWMPAWRAVKDYLDLVSRQPDRIRRCAHPACNLYFFDISRNGTRRWCSMDGCGSRTKAARHYQRQRSGGGQPG